MISLAPMHRLTDYYFRHLIRTISPHTMLYTEMINCNEILRNPNCRALKFSPHQIPLGLQLAGFDISKLLESAYFGESLGFSEINLNIGCPSQSAAAGLYGAYMLPNLDLIISCIKKLATHIKIPVSVKTRLGNEDNFSLKKLIDFVNLLYQNGCRKVIIHARLVNLAKISCKKNRLQPLDYQAVYNLKREVKSMQIVINGNIKNLADIKTHLKHVDGVMIGRYALQNPYFFAELENHFWQQRFLSRCDLIFRYLKEIEKELARSTLHANFVLKPLFNIFYKRDGAKEWRFFLNQFMKDNFTISIATVIKEYIQERVLLWQD